MFPGYSEDMVDAPNGKNTPRCYDESGIPARLRLMREFHNQRKRANVLAVY